MFPLSALFNLNFLFKIGLFCIPVFTGSARLSFSAPNRSGSTTSRLIPVSNAISEREEKKYTVN